jgi:hypothetical protein
MGEEGSRRGEMESTGRYFPSQLFLEQFKNKTEDTLMGDQ